MLTNTLIYKLIKAHYEKDEYMFNTYVNSVVRQLKKIGYVKTVEMIEKLQSDNKKEVKGALGKCAKLKENKGNLQY
ncbi:MAG TPA: hypothetical protein IAD10_08520 [Candidatus Fimicola cottocaccae]|nr:hypothetical protein [Candidatus Fimicola cottocaccae]